MKTNTKLKLGTALAVALTASVPAFANDLGISDENFSLEALIEAAKGEPPIVVVDATGKIKTMANNFTAHCLI